MKDQSEFPLVTERVLKSTYIVPDKETGNELYRELLKLSTLAGMHARKWLSSVPEVLECTPYADCVTEVDLDRGNCLLSRLWECCGLPVKKNSSNKSISPMVITPVPNVPS